MNGSEVIQETFSGKINDAMRIASDLAELFITKGAVKILDEIRGRSDD